jgi:hypothetical protein
MGAVELLADESAIAVTEAIDETNTSTTFRRLRDASRQMDAVTSRDQHARGKQGSDV